MEDISLALFDSVIPGTEGLDLLTTTTGLLTDNSQDSLLGISGASALLGSGLLGGDDISNLVTELVIVPAADGIVTGVVGDAVDPFVGSSVASVIGDVSGSVAGDVAGDVARSVFSPSEDDTDTTSESVFDLITGLFF